TAPSGPGLRRDDGPSEAASTYPVIPTQAGIQRTDNTGTSRAARPWVPVPAFAGTTDRAGPPPPTRHTGVGRYPEARNVGTSRAAQPGSRPSPGRRTEWGHIYLPRHTGAGRYPGAGNSGAAHQHWLETPDRGRARRCRHGVIGPRLPG